MTDINDDYTDGIQMATSEDQLPPDESATEATVDAPELNADEQKASDDQDTQLKAALSRRSTSQDTDDENLLGLAPGDTED